ncbi:hypothetical protein WAI453_003102 [Rhynchosporium graminicola]|uniref:Uncharacterized protein n=1 Tax=Rhynchosporium graminicola TaxID=2792576 RepID=A0A1E1LJ27_9HELO|nr:uncharacterized protein RCO7_07502 [Rhynchosporium commune]
MSRAPENPNNPPSSPYDQPEYSSIDAENLVELQVSSIPIFEMGDNSTDEEDLSGQESGGSSRVSQGTRINIMEWAIGGSGENTPRAVAGAEILGDDDSMGAGSFHSGSGVTLSSDDEAGDPADLTSRIIQSNRFAPGYVVEDQYAGEDISKEVLPGVFGEPINYRATRNTISPGTLDLLPGSPMQDDLDISVASDSSSVSHISESTLDNSDTPQHNTTDAMWMDSLLNFPWINKDLSMILDPASRKLVVMPQTELQLKKAVIDLYKSMLRGVWFIQLSARGLWLEQTFPDELWWDVFTDKESEELQRTLHKQIYEDIVTRAITVVEEWRLRSGFAKVPETERELEDAEEKVGERREMKQLILDEASKKSVDRWVRFLFGGVIDAEHLHRILGCSLSGVRQCIITKVMLVTEWPFGECWTVKGSLQEPLHNRRKVNFIIDGQLDELVGYLNVRDE